jgi:two-component system, NarL family, nitrate/nitrite response regulator NarL
MVRASVVRAIDRHPGLRVVAEAGDGVAALSEIRTRRPDIAVLDVRMPGRDGLAVLETVVREQLGTRVVLFSGLLAPAQVARAQAAGVAAVLDKSAEPGELVETILAVAQGRTVVPDGRAAARTGLPHLSAREQQILALMADGYSGPQIARTLYLSLSTVKTHTEKLYAKLGVSDRAAAVAVAMRHGLVA